MHKIGIAPSIKGTFAVEKKKGRIIFTVPERVKHSLPKMNITKGAASGIFVIIV